MLKPCVGRSRKKKVQQPILLDVAQALKEWVVDHLHFGLSEPNEPVNRIKYRSSALLGLGRCRIRIQCAVLAFIHSRESGSPGGSKQGESFTLSTNFILTPHAPFGLECSAVF